MSQGHASFDQFWECPVCHIQVGMGQPARMHPPTCGLGHEPRELEQISADRFGRFEDA